MAAAALGFIVMMAVINPANAENPVIYGSRVCPTQACVDETLAEARTHPEVFRLFVFDRATSFFEPEPPHEHSRPAYEAWRT